MILFFVIYCFLGHRYDQSALTIIYTHFFGYPKANFLPPSAFLTDQINFKVKRGQKIKYFV